MKIQKSIFPLLMIFSLSANANVVTGHCNVVNGSLFINLLEQHLKYGTKTVYDLTTEIKLQNAMCPIQDVVRINYTKCINDKCISEGVNAAIPNIGYWSKNHIRPIIEEPLKLGINIIS